MTFEMALRLTEMSLGWASVQQSAEHLVGPRREQVVFGLRLGFGALLVVGVWVPFVLLALLALGVAALHLFDGPYNGGSDRMGLLCLVCLTLGHWLPPQMSEAALAYLAVQLVLSYFISGQVKLVNAEWRSGRALRDVFAFSAYPVSKRLRGLARYPGVLRRASWGVIGFEVAFPLALISMPILILALTFAAGFHLANAFVFGLNRFFWTWLAAYPSILWLQGRLIGDVW